MSKYPKDLSGERFGRLVAIKPVPEPEGLKEVKSKRSQFWLCVCDCGEIFSAGRSSLLNKNGTKSCGCISVGVNSSRKGMKYNKSKDKSNKPIPLGKTKIYRVWSGMKYRCTSPKSSSYMNYGGRGIKVCERWLVFEQFKEDMLESLIQFEKEHGEGSASLDRIDIDGNYEPENCRWTTIQEQNKNKRNSIKPIVNGVQYDSLVDLGKVYNILPATLHYRYKKGKRGLDLIDDIYK